MSVEIEDILMELVKNVGESNKKMIERITQIEENGRQNATHEDMVAIVKAAYQIREDTQEIICFVSDGENKTDTMTILTKWDRFWSPFIKAKGITGMILAITASICGIIWFIFKCIEWYPVIKHLLPL